MKAIVLSAGFGTRLAPLSDVIPKAMFPILGRSALSLISSQLHENGISDIGVNLYHLGDNLGAHILRIQGTGPNFFTMKEEVLMGTGGGIAQFQNFVGDDSCIVHNCDIVTNAPIYELADFHFQKGPLATLLLIDYPPINSVRVDQDGNIKDIVGKINTDVETKSYTFGGVSALSPELFDYFPKGEPFSIIDIYLKLIREKPGSVIGWIPDSPFYWRDIGSFDSYLDLHEDILVKKSFTSSFLDIPKDDVTYKGYDVFIHAGARLEGFNSFGHHVRIPKAAVLKDTVIWPGTDLPKGFRATRKIIYKNIMVPI